MIAALHEIGQHMDSSGRIAKGDFKIVYVAPMKALAAEMTKTFGSRLQALGIQVSSSIINSICTPTKQAALHVD
jgi:activating signal cointegrator complex subunit 3